PQPALRVIRGLALVVSPLAVVTLGLTLWMFLELAAGPEWRWVDPAPLKRTAPSLRRIVWIVFEELDQRITFEARPAGLELPEIDRLRRESLYADAAHPPAGTSDVSMPALITGRPVVAVAPTSPNELEITFADGKAARWSAQPNVFSRARTLIYDRATGRLTAWNFTGAGEGYLDNLALADRLLGDLRRAIDRAHLADRTWIVVTSDGWWRASTRYDGLADHRVPFLVRPPDGGRGAHVDAPFNTVGTHDLILAILRGSVSDSRDPAA